MHTITLRTLKMLQVRVNRKCTRISFSFRKKSGNHPWPKYSRNESTKSSAPQLTDNWRTINRACPWGLQRPWEKFGSVQLCRIKANFVDRRKLLLRGYKFKKTKHSRFGKIHAATEAEEIDDRSRGRTWTTSAGRLSCFFFSFSTIV